MLVKLSYFKNIIEKIVKCGNYVKSWQKLVRNLSF